MKTGDIVGRWLAAAVAWIVLVSATVEARDKGADDASQLVREAVRADLNGQSEEHDSILGLALQRTPECDLARWYSGQIKIDGRWVDLDDVPLDAKAERVINEYRRLRDLHANSPAGHLLLARYCRVAEASAIVEARLLTGSSWFTCCTARYLRALDSLASCRPESLYHVSVINFERGLIRYLNLEPGLEKAATTLSRHLQPLRARRPLYARAALLLATVYYKLGKVDAGDALLVEAEECLKGLKAGLRRRIEATLESVKTLSLLMHGDTMGALESAKREAELELETGDIMNYAVAMVHVAVLQYLAGLWSDLASTIEGVREAVGLVEERQARIILDLLLTVEVPFLVAKGRVKEAREKLAQALSWGRSVLEEGHLLGEALVLLAEGDKEEASRKARKFLEKARDALPGEREVAALVAGETVELKKLNKLPPGLKTLANVVLNHLKGRGKGEPQ